MQNNNLTEILLEIKRIANKYDLAKSKSNIQTMIFNISFVIENILDEKINISRDIAESLEFIRKDMISLHGKIGFNDYERFKVLCEQIDAHIVMYTMEVE